MQGVVWWLLVVWLAMRQTRQRTVSECLVGKVSTHRSSDFKVCNCNFEKGLQHTTLRAIPPVHYGMSTSVHRSIAIAKTGRKHIQTHASGWHFLFSFCFATSFSFQATGQGQGVLEKKELGE